MNLHHIWKGALSGLLATILASVAIFIQKKIGFSIHFNPIEALSNGLHLDSITHGWYLHYGLGILFGIIFSVIYYHIPGEAKFRGCIYATGIWLLMMLTVMPLSGMGFFAMHISSNIPMYTFIMHLIYGIFLGITYGWLDKNIDQ